MTFLLSLQNALTQHTTLIVLSFIALALILLLFAAWRKSATALRETKEQVETIEEEEYRMFEFLHTLGIAIEEDHSANKLHREIIDGIVTVVNARGGAIYLLDKSGNYLQPTHLTDHCPLLVGLPVEVLEKAKKNPKSVKSSMRLSKIPADEGILGSVLHSGVAEHIPEVKNHPAFRDSLIHYEENITALIAPLTYGGKDIGVIAITRTHSASPFTNNEFQLFRSAAEQSAFALGNANIHHEASEKRKIDSELRIAREVQSILLPNENPSITGYRIFGTNSAARIISGDYFDYIPLGEGKWAIVIADVTGKGVAAGLLMATCRSALRSELSRENDPLEALARLNKQVFADIREDMFISLAIYILREDSNEVEVICAGHDKAPLHRKNGDLEWIKPPGLALGLDDGDVFSRVTKKDSFTLESGDSLLLYTDGVTEALNVEQDEFGAERMAESFQKSAVKGAEGIVTELTKDLETFVGNYHQMDDITMIAIKRR